MTIEQLQDINRVKQNLTLVIEYYNAISNAMDIIKNEVKEWWESKQFGNINCRLSSYKKLVPVDINKVLEKYPYETNKELYTLSLTKGAQSVITDESLFKEQEIKSVTFVSTVVDAD